MLCKLLANICKLVKAILITLAACLSPVVSTPILQYNLPQRITWHTTANHWSVSPAIISELAFVPFPSHTQLKAGLPAGQSPASTASQSGSSQVNTWDGATIQSIASRMHVVASLHPAPIYGIIWGGGPVNCIFSLSLPDSLFLPPSRTVCTHTATATITTMLNRTQAQILDWVAESYKFSGSEKGIFKFRKRNL